MPDILRMLSQAEQLDFSQNFLMPRANYLGDAIFPDQKTQNFKAEYLRLAAGAQLPTISTTARATTKSALATRSISRSMVPRTPLRLWASTMIR